MAAGKKSHILESVYLVKLLTNYIQFGLNFCQSYPYHFANSVPEYGTR